MRLVATSTVKKGTVLAKAIYNERGQVLLNEGVKLEERLIKRLQNMGISYLYIKDPETDDIHYKSPIPDQLRRKAITTIESTFRQLQHDSKLSETFVIEKASKELTELVKDLHSHLKNNTDLLNLLSDVWTYDHYIFSHSLNVTLYSLAIGIQLKLPAKKLETLGLGAILHDVGKMKVPNEILMKPGKLTKEEFEEVKKHSEEGFHILRNVQSIPLLVAHCAFQHHERLNGSGYPRGIKGNEIHEFGKIIAVADVFDAVTSNRVYRQAMLPHEGLEILYAGAGTLFETKIVEAFRNAVAVYPVGANVDLNDGRKGVVCRQNVGFSDRPVVRIFEEDGRKVDPYEVDLKNELSYVITGCSVT
jgi:putative nucleotidyltransferase with HDIG domain